MRKEKRVYFYQTLKNSAQDVLAIVGEDHLPDRGLQQARTIVKDLESIRNVPKKFDVRSHFLIGTVLLAIKNQWPLAKPFVEYARKNIVLSNPWSRGHCTTTIRLKYSTMDVNGETAYSLILHQNLPPTNNPTRDMTLSRKIFDLSSKTEIL